MFVRHILHSSGRFRALRLTGIVRNPNLQPFFPRYISHEALVQAETLPQQIPVQAVIIEEARNQKVEDSSNIPHVQKKLKRFDSSLNALESQYEQLPVKFPIRTIDLIDQFDECAKRKVGWTIFLPSMQKEILNTVLNDFHTLSAREVGLLLIAFGKMGVEWKDFSRKLQRTIQQRIKKIPGKAKKEKMPIVFILRNLLQGLSSLHFYDHSSKNKPEEAKEMMEAIHQIIEIIHENNLMQKKNGSNYIPFIFQYYFSLSSSISSSSSSSFQWNVLDPKVSEYFFSLLMISYLSGKFSAPKYMTILHSLAKAQAPIDDFPNALKDYLEAGMNQVLSLKRSKKKAEVVTLIRDLHQLKYPFQKLKYFSVMNIIDAIDELKDTLSAENFVKVLSVLPYLSFDMVFEYQDEKKYRTLLTELIKIYHQEQRDPSSELSRMAKNNIGVASFFAYLRTFPRNTFTVTEDWKEIPLPLLVPVSHSYSDDSLPLTFARELRNTWEKKYVESGSLPDIRFVPEKDVLDCGIFVAPVTIERQDDILATILFEEHETNDLSREEQFREFLYGKFHANIQIWRVDRSKALESETIENIIGKIENLPKD